MNILWKTILESSVLICVVAFLRGILLQRLPKKTFLGLWMVVLFRLLVPVSIPSPLSIYALLRNTGQSDAGKETVRLPATLLQGTGNAAAVTPSAGVQLSPRTLLWLLWGIGACIAFAYFVQAHIRFKRKCADSLPLDTPAIRAWQQEHPLRRPVRIRQSDRIHSPLTYGLMRPMILLPRTALYTPEQLTYVLLHEYTHIRRFDILLKWLFTITRCLYWFNPFVHLMVCLAMRDIELACDETVLQTCGEQARASYALTLLEMEETRIPASPSCTCFSYNNAKERITAIMKMKKVSVLAIIFALALVAGTVTVFATSRPAGNKYHPADEPVSIQMTTEETYLRALQESIEVEKDTFSFTLPSAYTEKISIWIAGRIVEDGVSMSAHYLTAESEGDSWKSGETYSFMLDGKLSELLMSVTLDGEETLLDLTGYLPEEHLYTEAEPAGETSKPAKTYYSADAGTSAPSEPLAENPAKEASDPSYIRMEKEAEYLAKKAAKEAADKEASDSSYIRMEEETEYPADDAAGTEYLPGTPTSGAETHKAPSETEAEYSPSLVLSWPLPESTGSVSVSYGEYDHNGVDIAAAEGTEIYAAADGTVASAGFDETKGNYVLIDHGGYQTLYCSCKSVAVKEGDTVSAGACIGYVGKTGTATGPHLHFELQMDGATANPLRYMPDQPAS